MDNEQMEILGEQDKKVLKLLENYLDLSKTELVALIEHKVSKSLGYEMGDAFRTVREKQQIRSGEINLDRAHKSVLVLIAYALENSR